MSTHKEALESLVQGVQKTLGDTVFIEALDTATAILLSALTHGKKVLIAGNGGSAAEAQHFAAEIVGRYMRERRGYPAVALTTDTSIITAVANDYAFDAIFSRQVEALGDAGDVLVCLSTSGNSTNLIRAIEVAKMKGLHTVSFIGKGGGKMKGMAETDVIVPLDETPRIQEIHLAAIHSVCSVLDSGLPT